MISFPCFHPEYYLSIYTKTATEHKFLLNNDWQASWTLLMGFNYVILKVLYFLGLRWWQISILGSYNKCIRKHTIQKYFVETVAPHNCCWQIYLIVLWILNTTAVTVQSEIKYMDSIQPVFWEKGSGFHMSFLFSSELLNLTLNLVLKHKCEWKFPAQD